jgi:hypothetical protein
MTLASQIASDVSAIFLELDDFAVQMRRYVGGDSANQVVFTGIITWQATTYEEDRGRGTRRRGEILVADSVDVAVTDSILIGTDLAQVEAVGQSQDGAKTVYVVQTLPLTRGAKTLRTGAI